MQKKSILFIGAVLIVGFFIGYYFGSAGEKVANNQTPKTMPIYIYDTPRDNQSSDSDNPTPPTNSAGLDMYEPGFEPGLVACPMDARICPDGTTVGRQGPNCEFTKCPNQQ